MQGYQRQGTGMSETWLYDEHPAMFRAHPFLFLLLLISVVGILAIGVWWVLRKGERLALSDREVLLERGLLAKQRTEIALSSRSEEHTSELQSLMRISYAVFCLKKKKINNINQNYLELINTLNKTPMTESLHH